MKYLLLAMQFLPHVLSGVMAVENALKGAPGATKKAVVLSAISAAVKAGATVPEDHVTILGNLVDAVVTDLNLAGVFQTKNIGVITGHGTTTLNTE